MKRIFKYELTHAHRQVIELPQGHAALSVHIQKERPVLYCQVPMGLAAAMRVTVTAVLTGQDVPHDAGAYVGTVMFEDGAYVKHYFVNAEPAHV